MQGNIPIIQDIIMATLLTSVCRSLHQLPVRFVRTNLKIYE